MPSFLSGVLASTSIRVGVTGRVGDTIFDDLDPGICVWGGTALCCVSTLFALATRQIGLTASCFPLQFAHFRGRCLHGFPESHTSQWWLRQWWFPAHRKHFGGFIQPFLCPTWQQSGHTSRELSWKSSTGCFFPPKYNPRAFSLLATSSFGTVTTTDVYLLPFPWFS